MISEAEDVHAVWIGLRLADRDKHLLQLLAQEPGVTSVARRIITWDECT